VSSYSLNMTRSSYVREHPCLPFSWPVSAWVCSDGSKGSLASLIYNSSYAFLRLGFFLRSFFARLRKVLSGLTFIVVGCIKNSLHEFFRGFAFYNIRILFGFQHPFYQCLMSALPVEKVCREIPHLLAGCFRKHVKHFVNFRYFHCLHDTMIICGCFFVNIKSGELLKTNTRSLIPRPSFPPHIKYGAGSVKPGMTNKGKRFLTHYIRVAYLLKR